MNGMSHQINFKNLFQNRWMYHLKKTILVDVMLTDDFFQERFPCRAYKKFSHIYDRSVPIFMYWTRKHRVDFTYVQVRLLRTRYIQI